MRMRTRMPFAVRSAIPIAVMAVASLTLGVGGAAAGTPKPLEPPVKPKPTVTATAAPAPTPTPTATAAAAPVATTAAHASAAPASSAAPAGSVGSAKPSAAAAAAALNTLPSESGMEGLLKWANERKATLETRRTAERDLTRATWGSLVDQPAVVAELRTHAERTARLERIQALAKALSKPTIAARAQKALASENVRHQRNMQALAGGAK
jgi:hypothetical protein